MGSLFEAIDDYVVICMSLTAVVFLTIAFRFVWGYFRLFSRRRRSIQLSAGIRNRSSSDYDCPICMESPSFLTETNCSHRFCADCFILHWKRTIYSGVISCPMCRGRVSTLTMLFTEEELQDSSTRRSRIEADIRLFNRWHSGEPISIIDRIRDIPLFVYGFIQLLLSGEGTVALMQIRLALLGFCALFYLITPFDFIPDITGFIGILDDMIVICIFIIHFVSVYQTISSRQRFNSR